MNMQKVVELFGGKYMFGGALIQFNEESFKEMYKEIYDAAMLTEREACAQMCEDNANDLSEGDWDSACYNCADHIRARTDHDQAKEEK